MAYTHSSLSLLLIAAIVAAWTQEDGAWKIRLEHVECKRPSRCDALTSD